MSEPRAAGEPVIVTSKLTRTYPLELTSALDQVDLVICEGEFVAVMGPSGCGKSTLLNILGLLDAPTAGSYELFGRRVDKLSDAARTRLRRFDIAFVFQSYELIDHQTVVENVETPLTLLRLPRLVSSARAREAVDAVGLSSRAHAFPSQLSGGERQRVSIARAFVARKRLILCDEPTGNLDSSNADEVISRLRQMNSGGATIILVTHDPGVASVASRCIQLKDGRVLTDVRTPPLQAS